MAPHRLLVAVPVALVLGLGPASVSAHPVPVTDASAVPAPRVGPGEMPESPLDLAEGSLIADGRIYGLTRDGDTVYATGDFDTIGRYDSPGDVLDGTTGARQPSPEISNGQISVVVGDGAGGWYLGGDFEAIGGEPSGGLAHVLADGSLDPAFLPQTDGLVSAIALQGTTLYVGGDFHTVEGAERKRLAAISTVDGSLLPFDAPHPQRVTELVASPTAVYVGSNRVVAVDPVTGAAVPGFTPYTGGLGGVRALELGGGHLYVGTDRLVSLDPATGAADTTFDPPGSPQDYRSYHSLLWTASALYAGSDRSNRLFALDPDTGAVDLGFAPTFAGSNATFNAPGGVYDLGLDGDRLWVAGSFTSAGGEKANGLAVVDAATGAREEVDLPTYNQQVNAVEPAGGDVYVGGAWFMTDWTTAHSIAALDAETLDPVPGFEVAPYVYGDLLVAPSTLYLTSTHFQGYDNRDQSPHLYYPGTTTIRAFDPDTGATLKGRFVKVKNLTGTTVVDDRLYVARRLSNDVRFPRNRIDVYSSAGTKVRSFTVPLAGYITTMTSVDGDLVLAGSFKRKVNSAPRNTAMLRLDPRTGARRPAFDPRINGPVYDVVEHDGSLYASGLFKKVYQGLGSIERPGLVKLSAMSAKDETFQPGGFSANRVLMRLHPAGDVLFVDGTGSRFLDLVTGAVVDSPAGGAPYEVDAITTGPAGGYVYAGSQHPNLGGNEPLRLGFISPID